MPGPLDFHLLGLQICAPKLSFFKDLFYDFCLCVHARTCLCVCVQLRKTEAVDPPGAGITGTSEMLGIELRSSARAMCTVYHGVSFPASQVVFKVVLGIKRRVLCSLGKRYERATPPAPCTALFHSSVFTQQTQLTTSIPCH